MPLKVAPSPSMTERMAELLAGFADLGNYARYGVDADTKYRMALSGAVPGAKPVVGSNLPVEERRAAGYLFGQQWPGVAVPLTMLANVVRSPFEDPIMYQTAVDAAEQGVASVQPTLADILAKQARMGMFR